MAVAASMTSCGGMDLAETNPMYAGVRRKGFHYTIWGHARTYTISHSWLPTRGGNSKFLLFVTNNSWWKLKVSPIRDQQLVVETQSLSYS